MKPRNEIEKEVVRLHNSLPGLTIPQVKWIIRHDHDLILKDYEHSKRKVAHYYYYCIVTRCKGWQVMRYFLLGSSYCKRSGYVLNYVTEVSQRWMKGNAAGSPNLVIFEKSKSMCWYWHNQPFSLNSELSLKSWSSDWNRSGRTEFGLDDRYIYPRQKFTDEFAKSPLSRLFGREDEIVIYRHYSGILEGKEYGNIRQRLKRDKVGISENDALPVYLETLIKMEEIELFRSCLEPYSYIGSKIQKYWRSFVLAKRHNLNLGGCTWTDWFEYVDTLHSLEYDIRSPHYLCPPDLGAAHATMLARAERRRTEIDKEKEKKNIEKYEGPYAKSMGAFFGIMITTRHLVISPIRSVAEMKEEGDHMHHCVYQCGYYKKPDSLILSAKDKEGKRQETIEVSLRNFSVVQSRAIQNGTSVFHKEILTAMKRNMGMIQKIQEERLVTA